MMLGNEEMRSTKLYITAENEVARYNADAGILAEYERAGGSGRSFDYARSVLSASRSVPGEQIKAYLSRIQRGGLVQPFGCMIAMEGLSFRIIGYSENCFEMLGLASRPSGLIGVDARTLFTAPSVMSLTKAVMAKEITLLNPVWVHSVAAKKPFYAVLHRIDVGTVIDLEPARLGDPALTLAGAVQSQKLAVRAISRLQSLPGGDIGMLCDMVVEDVQRLTGYDRVMVYKFHDDDHGEVLSEIRRADLEPYLGLHYPATDIPQAARFLFKQNRIRIICDCNAAGVRVIQSEELAQPLCLVNSTLRAPHACHMQYMANMESIASLVMAIIINNHESTKLWGLVVCHHASPRYVPFTLRYACEFLMQAFGLQLYMELQLAAQLAEKRVIHTQTLLCDMLLRDVPLGIVTKNPSIKDLVKCDGAALYYGGKCWLIGVTPTESQVKDIADWLLTHHSDSTGLSTDSLADSGYPGASQLGDAVCGMATAKITSKDFLFWFRSHTAEEVKWGGAKHHPRDRDDGGRMHPRSSFKAFLEVVKSRSMPWEALEIDAIHSLQLIVRESFQEINDSDPNSPSLALRSSDTDMQGRDELTSVACEMVKLIETATVPIFGVDSGGFINGWNEKIAELTGLETNKAMGKSLVNDIVREDTREAVGNLLARALQGEEEKNIKLKLRNFGASTRSDIHIVANSCTSRDYKNGVVGVCFVGQDVTGEKVVMDKFIRLQGDYKAIIESLNPLIPPIFAADENACCSEWNAAMEKLTGFKKDEVIGKVLPGEVFGGFCKLKGQDSLTKFMIALYKGISGQNIEKQPLEFYDRDGNLVEVLLTGNRRTDLRGKVIGCFCFMQILVPDIQQASEACGKDGAEGSSKLRELAYMRQEMKSPMDGIRFTHKLLESTAVSESQKQFLEASEACQRQIMAIIEGDLGSIEENKLELNMEEFRLGNVVDAVVSQVMILLREKNLQLYHEVPEEIKSMYLYGDHIRLQLVLSDLLINVVHHSPTTDGWVKIDICPGQKSTRDDNEFIQIQFRMSHPGEGIPASLIQDMFDNEKQWTTQEGLGLNLSQKLLSRMNGSVKYMREQSKCFFVVDIELQTTKKETREAGTSSKVDSSRMT